MTNILNRRISSFDELPKLPQYQNQSDDTLTNWKTILKEILNDM